MEAYLNFNMSGILTNGHLDPYCIPYYSMLYIPQEPCRIFSCMRISVCLVSLKPVFICVLINTIISIFYFKKIIIIYLFWDVSLYFVCVSYQMNVRSTMEIRRSRLCSYFLVLPFYNMYWPGYPASPGIVATFLGRYNISHSVDSHRTTPGS